LEKDLYQGRSYHLQNMSFLGMIAEHLIKLILIKRGYVINDLSCKYVQFSPKFMEDLNLYNSDSEASQEKLNELYSKASKELKIKISDKLIKFDKIISIFEKSNPKNYYQKVGELKLNKNIKDYVYLDEFTELNPKNCFRAIQKSRNFYIHKAEAQNELNGICWYFHNFLLWIAKKEYPDFFHELIFIGCIGNQRLFEIEPKLNSNKLK